MIITTVPSWVLGAAVLVVIGWGVIKLFFGAAGSVIDSVEMSNAKNKDQQNFENYLKKDRAKFEAFIQSKNLTYETVISSNNNLDEIKKSITEIFEIDIYNDKHLLGKTFKLLEDELIGQVTEYAKIGGIYD